MEFSRIPTTNKSKPPVISQDRALYWNVGMSAMLKYIDCYNSSIDVQTEPLKTYKSFVKF